MSAIVLNCIIVEGLTYTAVPEQQRDRRGEFAGCYGCAFHIQDMGSADAAAATCRVVRDTTRESGVQHCATLNVVWVPAEYATPITSWADALKFFDALQRMDQVFHPDDDPIDVIHAGTAGTPVFYEPVATMVAARMAEARRVAPDPDNIYTELMERS